MRIGSLFSGIGGLELGLERAGLGETVWQCEINPYARRVLAKHWPGVTIYEDIGDIDESAESVDLVCGGFPCQDISVAGKGAGLGGERSGLWFEMLRVIRALRPSLVVVENVPALLNRGMGRVLGDLAESGFDCWWDCIPASAVGAPHRRDRVFIVAHTEREGLERHRPNAGKPEEPEPRDRGAPEDVAHTNSKRGDGARPLEREAGWDESQDGSNVAHPNGHHRQRGSGDVQMGRKRVSKEAPHDGLTGGTQWEVEPDVGRVVDGVPSRMDRLRCLGNAVVPQVAEYIGRLLMERLKDE